MIPSLLRRIPVRRILTDIERAAGNFLTPDSDLRRQAVESISRETAFSPPMVAMAIDWTFSELTADAMRRLLLSELGHEDVADDPSLGSPGRTLVISAGAIFQPAVNASMFSLLVKSAVTLKCSSHERTLLPFWANALRAANVEIGNEVRVIGDSNAPTREHDDALDHALSESDAVIAFGSDETLAAFQRRIRDGVTFVGHGHKASVALVDGRQLQDTEARAAAQALALDVAMYEQSGCMSPQNVFICSGSGTTPENFACLLAEELGELTKTFPVGNRPVEQDGAIESFRSEFEFQSSQDKRTRCFFGGRLNHTVVFDPKPLFRPTPLGRTILVKPINEIGDVIEALQPVRGHLQAVGSAPGSACRSVESSLRAMGASYFCNLGRMQRPPLAWQNANLPCIRSLLR